MSLEGINQNGNHKEESDAGAPDDAHLDPGKTVEKKIARYDWLYASYKFKVSLFLGKARNVVSQGKEVLSAQPENSNLTTYLVDLENLKQYYGQQYTAEVLEKNILEPVEVFSKMQDAFHAAERKFLRAELAYYTQKNLELDALLQIFRSIIFP